MIVSTMAEYDALTETQLREMWNNSRKSLGWDFFTKIVLDKPVDKWYDEPYERTGFGD